MQDIKMKIKIENPKELLLELTYLNGVLTGTGQESQLRTRNPDHIFKDVKEMATYVLENDL